jgi:hypothetical protein
MKTASIIWIALAFIAQMGGPSSLGIASGNSGNSITAVTPAGGGATGSQPGGLTGSQPGGSTGSQPGGSTGSQPGGSTRDSTTQRQRPPGARR